MIKAYTSKFYTLVTLLLLTISFNTSAFDRVITYESLFIVLSNPDDYYGKKLIVSGFISGQGVIFPTKELSRYGLDKNGLLIDVKDETLKKKIHLKEGHGYVSGYLCKTRDVNPLPYLCNIDRLGFKEIKL